jgi:hypothetical protein
MEEGGGNEDERMEEGGGMSADGWNGVVGVGCWEFI